jgi:hypothetical protein
MNDNTVKQEFTIVNGMTGQVISRKTANGEWAFETVTSIEVVEGKIARIYSQRNPDKLKALLKDNR